mgnify:CR=1 FL=1
MDDPPSDPRPDSRRGPGTDPRTDPRPLLDALRSAFEEATTDDARGQAFVARLFARLDAPGEPCTPRGSAASRLPACRHLAEAVAPATARAPIRASDPRPATPTPGAAAPGAATPGAATPDAVSAVARALERLAPALDWYRRIGSEAHGHAFHDGHADAFVIGDGGLETRARAAVGVSLMAPGLRYPDHHHAPEELHLVLSPGHWRHGASAWFEPGIGGTVHNVPDIVHAMRSGEAPLLAIRCLLDG